MSRTNETRHKDWHETRKSKCRLDENVCNMKQHLNINKWRWECKELIDKGICDEVFTLNPSNCDLKCDKSCYKRQYLDYENCKCRKN